MGAVVALEGLLAARTLWHAGRSATIAGDGEPSGHAALDALLPQGGWPRRALTELLLPADGIGELALLLPTLARCTQAGDDVAVVAPPYLPYAPAWQAAGVELSRLQVVQAAPRDALWAFEQCLRSGACAAVLGWPVQADARAMRRLQVAADSGGSLGFALRERRHAANPSPAALRLEATRDAHGGIAWQVRKCRGGPAPARAFVLPERAGGPVFGSSPGLAPAPRPQAGEGAHTHLSGIPLRPVEEGKRMHMLEPRSRVRERGEGGPQRKSLAAATSPVASLFPIPDAEPASRCSTSPRGQVSPESDRGAPASDARTSCACACACACGAPHPPSAPSPMEWGKGQPPFR